jgi:hypothetical protein
MNMLLWIIGGIFVASFVFFVYSIFVAPEGYEDEDGFHYGKEDE